MNGFVALHQGVVKLTGLPEKAFRNKLHPCCIDHLKSIWGQRNICDYLIFKHYCTFLSHLSFWSYTLQTTLHPTICTQKIVISSHQYFPFILFSQLNKEVLRNASHPFLPPIASSASKRVGIKTTKIGSQNWGRKKIHPPFSHLLHSHCFPEQCTFWESYTPLTIETLNKRVLNLTITSIVTALNVCKAFCTQ